MKNLIYNNIFRKRYESFSDLEQIIAEIDSKEEKGEIFEQFSKLFFEIKSEYYDIKHVWIFDEIPHSLKKRFSFGDRDEGVDLLIETNSNKYIATQVKFRSDRSSATGNEYKKLFSEGYKCDDFFVFANSFSIPPHTKKRKPKTVLLNDLLDLDVNFFKNLFEYVNNKKNIEKLFYSPKKHQKRAIKKIINGFKKNNRGKFISACGTGKTLTSLWIKENMKSQKVLFLVPSISLIKQTLDSWIDQRKSRFAYFCVCSTKIENDNEDYYDIDPNQLGIVNTSTDPKDVRDFIEDNDNNDFVIFSTYHSAEVISEAVCNIDFAFDIIFYDEAHHTAGQGVWTQIVRDDFIKSDKRLFMTATERVVKFEKNNRDYVDVNAIFSMDNLNNYGPVFENYTFGEAIIDNEIADYKIVFMAFNENDQIDLKTEIDSNTYLSDDQNVSVNELAQVAAVEKLITTDELQVNKIINFSNKIADSEKFISNLNKFAKLEKPHYFVDHISSRLTSKTRESILYEFGQSDTGIISNARCLTEGVDVPDVDCVIFSQPRRSLIDIIQACGRALRKPPNLPEKISTIFIPVILTDNTIDEDDLQKYLYIFEIIQSLKDQDSSLRDEINILNEMIATGSDINDISEGKIIIKSFKDVNITELKRDLYFKIARINSRKDISILNQFLSVEKARKTPKVIFSLMRYRIKALKNLIDRGVDILQNDMNLTKNEFKEIYCDYHNKVKIDNNLLSHLERCGIISDIDNIYLSNNGKQYKSDKSDKNFLEIIGDYFLTQNNLKWHPYNIVIKIMKETKKLSNLQFFYGINLMIDESEKSIESAIERLEYLSKYNEKIMLSSKENTEKLISDLNKKFKNEFSLLKSEGYTVNELYTPTKYSAEFSYLKNHMTTLWPTDFYEYEDILYLK